MADLTNKLFRRTKAGDPVCEVLDTQNLNFVYSVLESIEGVYCRIEKPTENGGRGWRIVFDPAHMDAAPADGKPFSTFVCADADLENTSAYPDDPLSLSLTLRDNYYRWSPASGESGSAENINASAVYRLYGFRSEAGASASFSGLTWGSGAGGHADFTVLALSADGIGGHYLRYCDLAEVLYKSWSPDSEVCGATRTTQRLATTQSGPMPYVLQLYNFADASGFGGFASGQDILMRRLCPSWLVRWAIRRKRVRKLLE